jgi:hypothetical protein
MVFTSFITEEIQRRHRLKGKKSIVVAVIVIQFLVSIMAEAELVYLAESHCSITGATGNGYALTIEKAITMAIKDCIDKGGVAECCANDAQISRTAHSATAHCSATGWTGTGVADDQDNANTLAIADCINKGGIPQCCRNGLSY